jgi:Outer membrane protein beta-barrel domain
MRKVAFLLCLFLLAPVAARAQKFDLFGGYSYARFEQKGGDVNASGWEAALIYKVNSYVGIVGDFTGNYGTLFQKSMSVTNIYGGVQVGLPMLHYSPFVHVLLGGMHLSIPSVTHTAFSTEVGGGLDIHVNHYLSIRAIQADVVTGDLTSTSADGRISTGVVFHF